MSPAGTAEGLGALAVAAVVLLSYLSGSVPFGLLVVRAASGADVRTVGSGNIGATNVARAAGKRAAFLTLGLDALKGLLPVLLAGWLAGPAAPSNARAGALAGAAAVAAVVGHCFPVWLHFRGGKGVATGLGVTLGLSPWAALAGAAVWLLLFQAFRVSSIGSLSGVVVALVVAGFTVGRSALLAIAAVALLILVRHADNLRRLLGRGETKL